MSKQNSYDLTNLKLSWTKYDIVQVLDVIKNKETIDAFKNKEIVINEPTLKRFLNIKTLKSKTPEYWHSIQNYPKTKKLFALLSVIFTHHEVISIFKENSNNNKGGVLRMISGSKMYTNIRSVLIESGAALPSYRRADSVPYDFSFLFENGEIGLLAKEMLVDRLNSIFKDSLTDSEFYEISDQYYFAKSLGLTKQEFQKWLSGKPLKSNKENRYIKVLNVQNFYSIKDIYLNIGESKEVYFLGENGDGKSLVLMALYLAFRGDFIVNDTEHKETGAVIDLIKNANDVILNGLDSSKREYGIGKSAVLPNLYAYGTHRGRYAKEDTPEKYGFMSLFDIDQTLENPIVWLRQQKAIENEKLLEAKKDNSSFIDYPTNIAIKRLEKLLYDVLERNLIVDINIDKVRFKEKGVYINFDQLSEGYRSILIFVIDLLIRLINNSEDQDVDLESIAGIVLIDEIDQHLHLSWQKIIVSRLREVFPKIQFIMTTHSPTIIQGASDEAVIFRVFRDQDTGRTKISEPVYRKDLDDLMINSLITHPIFGLDTARLGTGIQVADTSDDYLQYRISKQVHNELEKKKKAGAVFISDLEIDKLINEIINKELDNDKDK